jgi:hypothetical protein
MGLTWPSSVSRAAVAVVVVIVVAATLLGVSLKKLESTGGCVGNGFFPLGQLLFISARPPAAPHPPTPHTHDDGARHPPTAIAPRHTIRLTQRRRLPRFPCLLSPSPSRETYKFLFLFFPLPISSSSSSSSSPQKTRHTTHHTPHITHHTRAQSTGWRTTCTRRSWTTPRRPAGCTPGPLVGLYKCNPVDTHSLKAPGFIQPLNPSREKPVSSLCFQMQLVPATPRVRVRALPVHVHHCGPAGVHVRVRGRPPRQVLRHVPVPAPRRVARARGGQIQRLPHVGRAALTPGFQIGYWNILSPAEPCFDNCKMTW